MSAENEDFSLKIFILPPPFFGPGRLHHSLRPWCALKFTIRLIYSWKRVLGIHWR